MENKGFKLIAFKIKKHKIDSSNNDSTGEEKNFVYENERKKTTKIRANKWYYLCNNTTSISDNFLNINCIVGKNGCGKTTIINAILSTFISGKSNNDVILKFKIGEKIINISKTDKSSTLKDIVNLVYNYSIYSYISNYHPCEDPYFMASDFYRYTKSESIYVYPQREQCYNNDSNSIFISPNNISKTSNIQSIKLCLYFQVSKRKITFPLRYINEDCYIYGIQIKSFSKLMSDSPNLRINLSLEDVKDLFSTEPYVLEICLKSFVNDKYKIILQENNNEGNVYEQINDVYNSIFKHIIQYCVSNVIMEEYFESTISFKDYYYKNSSKVDAIIMSQIRSLDIQQELPIVHYSLLYIKALTIPNIRSFWGNCFKQTMVLESMFKFTDELIIDKDYRYRKIIYCNEPLYIDDKYEIYIPNPSENNKIPCKFIEGMNFYLTDLLFYELFDYETIINTNNKNNKNNKRLLSDTSSGEQQLLNIRTNFLYNLINIESGLDTRGVMNSGKYVNAFFDEVELYLHPEWQRKFLSNLIDGIKLIKFNHIKGINITIATHSPFILSDVPKSNVLFLNEDGTPADKSKIGETFGANIHDLLKDGFFMESTIGEVARREIQKIVDFYYEVQDDNKKTLNERNADLEKRKAENKDLFEYIGSIIGDQYYKNTINFMLDEIYDRKKTDKLDDFLKGLSEEEKKALKEKLDKDKE